MRAKTPGMNPVSWNRWFLKIGSWPLSTLVLWLPLNSAVRGDQPTERGQAAIYAVSPDGDDAAAGTDKAPWRTLQHAADAVKPGDTVIVRAGTYAGFALGGAKPPGATADAPITFRAEPGAIINSCSARSPSGIALQNGCHYVTIQGFTIDNTSGTITRAGIHIIRSDHVRIIGNVCKNNGVWGIFSGFCDDTLVENNVTSGSKREHGIYLSNSIDRCVIRGNTSFSNSGCGIHLNGDVRMGGLGMITNTLVENNIIYDNGKPRGGSGINGDGLQNCVIRGNVLYDNHASGISLYKIDAAHGSRDNFIVNNTILMASDGRNALNIINGSTNNTVCNNILLSANPATGAIRLSADSRPGLVSDYNIVEDRFSTSGDRDSNISLTDWKAATGQDQHSLASTPKELFLNAPAHDFHLAPSSSALRAATTALAPYQTPRWDLEGHGFGSPPDIGAYQLSPRAMIRGGPAR
jgi:parallel beta-helix repeat protein